MIRVAMIGPVPEPWGGLTAGGGVATHVQGLLSVLPQCGVHVRLLADNTDAAAPARFPPLGDRVEVSRMIRPRASQALGGLASLGLRRIGRVGWRTLTNPELRGVTPLSRRARLAGQAANLDRFLAGDASDILHVHHAELRQFLCQQVVGTPLPLVATAHSVNVLVRPHPDWLVGLIVANYRRADWLIPVSNYVADVIVQHGADPARMTVIPNGVDVQAFRPREQAGVRAELGLEQDDLIALFTGNLIRRKGGDVLLKAAARCAVKHPRLRLILIGTGPEREALLRLAGELGIGDRLTLAGYRPLTEMPLWYQACDLFVMPSWAEGLSVSLLEAMSCGRPVVTSFPDVGDHDAVRDGETGLLTPFGDVDRLASALDQLASSPALRTRLGDAARRLVEEEFSWDIVGQKTVDVYRAVLDRRGSRP